MIINLHVCGTITVAANAAGLAGITVEVVFKNCTPFTHSISKISNKQIDTAKDIDVVMPMFNLVEYCDSYSKTS